VSDQSDPRIEHWREHLIAAAERRWPAERSSELSDMVESTARILARLDDVRLAPDLEPDFVASIGPADGG